MEEIWKDIAGYEGYYQISNLGHVKALERVDSNQRKHKEHILHDIGNAKGYYHVHLSKGNKAKWFLVHRLVAEAFLDKKDGCDIVNHLDNNPQNNNVCNLEWTTYKGNMQWAAKQGRMKGNDANLQKAVETLKVSVIATDRDGYEYYFRSQADAARELGLTDSMRKHIAAACRNDYGYKTVGGYRWRYANE